MSLFDRFPYQVWVKKGSRYTLLVGTETRELAIRLAKEQGVPSIVKLDGRTIFNTPDVQYDDFGA